MSASRDIGLTSASRRVRLVSFIAVAVAADAGARKRGLTVEPAVPEEHPRQELLSAWKSCIASGDTFGDPLTDFLVAPGDPALAKLNPLGKSIGLFEARNVLRAVRDADRLELLLRYQQSLDLHRNTLC